jgi:hypothetical protein
VGGSRLAGRDQPVLVDELYLEDRPYVGEALDLTGELAILGGEDSRRDSGWRRANLAMRALLLAGIVGLTFGGGAVLVWWLTSGGVSTDATRIAHAYLLDVKDANYAQAYGRLCAPQESLEDYSARLTKARAQGHGVTSFRLNAAITTASSDTSLSTTSGKVTFADGTVKSVSFGVEAASSDAPSCLDTDGGLAG